MIGLDPDMIFRIPALLITLTVHEYAHARMAVALGDPTPRVLGRLTLNPIAHLDPVGLIMMWLFKFGWAKPVPINPGNFANVRQGTILVSLAGPVSNILLALVTAIVIVLLSIFDLVKGEWLKVLWLTYSYNIVFAVFNLLPLPPLDGSKVVASLLPGRQAYAYERLEPYGPWILLALVYLGVISVVTRPLEYALSSFINGIIRLIF
ncbi:Zn-dependent protease [Anaerospora hongkongensis]|uniref:Zn-dependent protease n=1 Tax=Anaerospora hongkongensis TaxID=244830 RepID=A0A4R1Q3J9_9FIRM|nr:site-2 protease family protein [Anaerospora hongkongensis]TCL40068.1 Zn-dependent protease [Anaerospora hongkongensis]